ncbi:MAG: hypothetical protein GTO67_06365 [Gammaproteobacteria bacterium]|nr:hypothetical protein [Gammaproteobacteria bacterium]NIM72849.1 hypothetical protein [Gammaproteobacteria bacterium]NIN38307.1 hypothetical protein [Gammaproteobacteria bacterium]NIO24597.1 hypothetical protein [Gammaproteobacteria bacterium]NIO65206.1 hypothetical protein [Gammaproteobacteria bacterium]
MHNRITATEDQLIAEISGLQRRVSDAPDSGDYRARTARSYLKELLRFKQEMLELIRYRRAGKVARWQRRPELH